MTKTSPQPIQPNPTDTLPNHTISKPYHKTYKQYKNHITSPITKSPLNKIYPTLPDHLGYPSPSGTNLTKYPFPTLRTMNPLTKQANYQIPNPHPPTPNITKS
ncbi:hypothetical protein G9A89_000458 [Geosiphon pyriformis]|nr:hypothetical protein G9A89_000458 [Geosiphon pyriformis]